MRQKLKHQKRGVQKRCQGVPKDELSGRLAKVPNILSVRGRRLIPDARDIAHYGDVLKGIWWYALLTSEMRYSPNALSHMDEEFDGFVHIEPPIDRTSSLDEMLSTACGCEFYVEEDDIKKHFGVE